MFANHCAKCKKGKVFHHFMFMNEKCPSCGHKFESEEGYFLGAMILAYFISTLLALPILLLAIFKFDTELPLALLAASMVIAVTGPVVYRYAKLAWMNLENWIKI